MLCWVFSCPCIRAPLIAMALTFADRSKKTALWNPISISWLHIFAIQTRVTTSLVCTCKRFFQTSAHKLRNQCKHQQLCDNCLLEANSVASTTWVLGPFVHGRLQNLKTSEYTFDHGLTPLTREPTPWSNTKNNTLYLCRRRFRRGRERANDGAPSASPTEEDGRNTISEI